MRRLFNIIVWSALAAVSSGCATLVGGPSRSVRIESEPAGATVTFNGEVRGVTPLRVKLDRGLTSQRIGLHLDGYRPWTEVLRRDTNGWYYANIFFNMGFGMIPDAILGSKHYYYPRSIQAQLMSNEAWAEADARARRESAERRARAEEEARRRREAQSPTQARVVERIRDTEPGVVEYVVRIHRVMGTRATDDLNRVFMSVKARWPEPGPGGQISNDDIELTFMFSAIAPHGVSRYSDLTTLRCMAGGMTFFALDPDKHILAPINPSSTDRLMGLYYRVHLNHYQRLAETSLPVRCRLDGDEFALEGGLLRGIRELRAEFPVR